MTRRLFLYPPSGITIDFFHFYPMIIAYVDTVQHFAKRDITENHIADIHDMVFDWLLNRVKNFTVTPCPWSWRLYLFYDKEDALELFDSLFLDFLDFLRDKGISAKKHYNVNRGKQYRCICTETPKATPNFQ